MIWIKANHIHILSTYCVLYTCTYIISFDHVRSPARIVIAPKMWRWDADLFLSDPKAHSLSISQVTSPREFSLGSAVLTEMVIWETLGLQLSIFIPKGCLFLHKDHFSSEQAVDGICKNMGINQSLQLPDCLWWVTCSSEDGVCTFLGALTCLLREVPGHPLFSLKRKSQPFCFPFTSSFISGEWTSGLIIAPEVRKQIGLTTFTMLEYGVHQSLISEGYLTTPC